MRFLRRIKGVTLFNKVRSSEIRKSLNIELLPLRIERSELRRFGHVSRMPQERFPRLGLQLSEMLAVVADRDVWLLNLELLPPQPSRT